MLHYLNLFIIISLLALIWRRFHQRHVEMKYVYQMYALRDRLRRLAIENKIDPNNSSFQYFDLSISKAIEESYYITFYHILLYKIVHYNDEKIKTLQEQVEKDCKQYPVLRPIVREYIGQISRYLIDQHHVTIFFLKPIFTMFVGVDNARRWFKGMVSSVVVLPETSASKRFKATPSKELELIH